MKKENVNIIQEAEALKDVVWFLKGYLAINEGEYSLSSVHIKALQKAINYIYENENKKD
jgi:hypothetical protein